MNKRRVLPMITTENFTKRMQEDKELVEAALCKHLSFPQYGSDDVIEGMRYSLLGGGKRIRAILALEFCRICGSPAENALPFACALEMIHAYSLVHDDLPCMDNDDMRRGQPSCHKKFGEASALLVGDGLLTLAFRTIADGRSIPLSAERVADATQILADFAGIGGMIGGQVLDIASEGKQISLEKVIETYEGKTCALFRAAARLGCCAADAKPEWTEQADRYADALGMAFQIRDDILDITGDEGKLGKPIGSDLEKGKCTYVTLRGLEKSEQDCRVYTEKAIQALSTFPEEDRGFFIELAHMLTARQD